MLKYRLFKAFALLMLAFGIVSGLIGMQMIRTRVVREAQTSVRRDLSSAWSVYNSRLQNIKTILGMIATKQDLIRELGAGDAAEGDELASLRSRLAAIRETRGLDFLTVTSPDRGVVMRSAPGGADGGYAPALSVILKAIAGTPSSGTVLLSQEQLEAEAEGLKDAAFTPLKETPRARPVPKDVETRGMVQMAAVPVMQNGVVVGCIYGGILVNHNASFVDRIQASVYEERQHLEAPVEREARPGTVTIFLGDVRVATTVRSESGNGAYGTRVSAEVAETVLDNGRSWTQRAFVVNDWYLTAYDPIRNPDGNVVGMLYVGILEAPFKAMGAQILMRYAGLAGLGLVAALVIAFILAGRLSHPLQRLATAAHSVRSGHYPESVPVDPHASREAADLVHAFNKMASALEEREAELKSANESLTIANRNYMETVEFVTHELKRPVASMVNYAYMLKEGMLGDLTEKQSKAANVIDRSLKNFSEMIRHYLNLARIENGELAPNPSSFSVRSEVVDGVLDSLQGDIEARGMRVENKIEENLELHADVNMTREAIDNFVGNAVKYGRDGGRIRLEAGPAGEGDFVEIRVWNEGEGIPAEKKDRLFKKFSRLEDQPAAGRQKGTGLGLFITKQIADAHGGTVGLDSKPGEWAEFRITLPASPGASKAEDPTA